MNFLRILFLLTLWGSLHAAPAVMDFNTAPLGKMPPGWRLYQKLQAGQTAPAVTGQCGERFIRIHTEGIRNAPAAGMARNFPAKPGQKYRIGFRVRNPHPETPVQLNFNGVFRYDGNRYGHGRSVKKTLSFAQWETVTLDVEAPLKAEELIVELHTGWNRPGTLDADDYTSDFLTPDGSPSSVFGKVRIAPRDLHLETPLANAAIVVHTPEQRRLAGELNQVLPKPLPVVDAARYAECRKLDRNLIMLGHAEDNPAVFNLYMRHYVILDSRYPGPGGWNVRSLHDPFGDGHNVIFAGGSSEAGHRAAAEQLKKILRKHPEKLPRLAEICYPKAGEIRLAWGCEWDGFFGYGPISRNFAAYYMTGDAKYVRAALKIAFPDKAQVVLNNRMDRYDDGAEPIAKPYHYWGSNLALYWDMIEEDPVFSPEIRQKFTQKLYEQMQYWIHQGYGGWYRIYLNPLPHEVLADRHYLMEALCVYTVARYFEKHYPGIDSREGLRCCRNTFAPVWNGVTPQHGWRVWSPSMLFPALQYAMLEDWPRCRKNANFRGYADYLLLITSLRPGEWLNGFCGLYGAMALVLEDGAFARMQRHFMRDGHAALIGPAYWSLDRKFALDSLRDSVGKIRAFRREKTEYVSLRSAADGTGDYLLLAPRTQPGSRAAFGNNAVEELQIAGQPVIEGASQLYFSADGLAEETPAEGAEVLIAGKSGDTAVFRTRMTASGDYEWTRTLFLRKGRFLLAHDRVTVLRDTLARLENVWRPVPYSTGSVTPEGDILLDFAGGPVPGAVFARNGRELFPGMRAGARRSYDEFTGCTLIQKGPAELHFELKSPVSGPLYWSILPDKDTGKLSFALDGKPLPDVPELTPGVFTRIRFRTGTLAAGKHVLSVHFSGSCRFGTFSLGGIPAPPFRISCSAPAVAECLPCRINAPDGGGTVPGWTGVFTAARRMKKGETITFATLIRPEKGDGVSAAEENGRIRLRMPEDAVLLPDERDGSMILAEAGKLTALQVKDKVRVIPSPVNDAEWRRLAAQPMPVPVRSGTMAADVPEKRPEAVMDAGAPVGFLCPAWGGMAVAAGNRLIFCGGKTWSHAFKGKIGALHCWKERELLTVGTDAEEIAALTSGGNMKFCVKSESAPEFIATNKVHWFKGKYPGVYALCGVRFAGGTDHLIAGSTGTVEILRPDGSCVKRFQQEYGPVDNLAVLNGKVYSSRSYGAFPATCTVGVSDGKIANKTVWMMESRSGTRMDRFGYSGVGKDRLFTAGNRLAGVFSGAQNHLMIWAEDGRIAADLNLGPGGIALPRNYALPALSERMVRGFAAGKDGFAAVTDKRLLYLTDVNGRLRRTVVLPAEPYVLAAAPAGWLVGIRNAVLRYDAEGTLQAHYPVTGKVTAIAGNGPRYFAGTDIGKLYRLD